MLITVFLHYKGEKTQRIKEYRDDTTLNLDEFVNGDLTFLGLPLPQDSACAWQSGIIKCIWPLDDGSYLRKYISAAFEAIDRQSLLTRSISMVGLSMDGTFSKASYITAPGVRHPTGYTPRAGPSYSYSTRTKRPEVNDSSETSRFTDGASFRRGLFTVGTTSDSIKTEGRQPVNIPDTPKASAARPPLQHTPLRNAEPPQSHSGSDAAADISVKVEETTVTVGQQPHALLSRHVAHGPLQHLSFPDASSSQAVPAIPSALSLATSATPVTSNGNVSSLTREMWDVRREIAALSAREIALQTQLKRLGARPAPEPPVGPVVEDDFTKLRAQLRAEYEARKAAERALRDERRRRELAEADVADVGRECKAPFVVPALVDAFLQMSRLTGEVIVGTGSSGGHDSRARE
ncbi:uncharacterized protein B0H18DRAFT_1198584 [Fomitopsis serialis]|uniref:uncharacterized protein n=1 Tax=Fomitopsis serialis TaxID=139415 RepID=UPI002007D792|nr:uncharacterized protein B0H18DRAFT_1198584 [Neoantrodia serialis]KAH9918492.1 hypothetical protein B0H18DRAFT_1198584 [Neoantrodia serialis]